MNKVTSLNWGMEDVSNDKSEITLYHYGSEPYTRIETMGFRNPPTRKELIKQKEIRDFAFHGGLYSDSVSFFPNPIPKNLTDILDDKFFRWVKGDVIYEHRVVITRDMLVPWEWESIRMENIAEYPSELSNDFKHKWFRERYELTVASGTRGGVKDWRNFVKSNEYYDGSTDKTFRKMGQATDISEKEHNQYAARVPHLIMYFKGGTIPVQSIKRIRL